MKYYLKFLGQDRQPCHGGSGQWPEPGVWTETIENPVPCESGYHLCPKQDILTWCYIPVLWVAEAKVVHTVFDRKVVASRARLIRQVEEWNDKTRRLFAADCAERVLHHFESKYPNDDRPRIAIETARRFALGLATAEEQAGAESAAKAAAKVALDSDARAARCAADSASSSIGPILWVVGDAAFGAAGSAACSIVSSADSVEESDAWVAAELIERNWQINHLLTHYLKLNPEEFE